MESLADSDSSAVSSTESLAETAGSSAGSSTESLAESAGAGCGVTVTVVVVWMVVVPRIGLEHFLSTKISVISLPGIGNWKSPFPKSPEAAKITHR